MEHRLLVFDEPHIGYARHRPSDSLPGCPTVELARAGDEIQVRIGVPWAPDRHEFGARAYFAKCLTLFNVVGYGVGAGNNVLEYGKTSMRRGRPYGAIVP